MKNIKIKIFLLIMTLSIVSIFAGVLSGPDSGVQNGQLAYFTSNKSVSNSPIFLSDFLIATNLAGGQYAAFNSDTNLYSTLNGYQWTNLNVFDTPTNTFSGTTFLLGTNQVITCSSNIYLISLGNVPPTGIERYGQLTIVATSDITVTNAIPGWKTSDMVSTRTLTNGNSMVIAADIILGVVTNFAIVQFH